MTLSLKAIQPVLDEVVAGVLSVTEPEHIVLFGSWARGDAGPDSDLDILVVAPFEGSRHVTGIALLRALANLPLPKDVILLQPEEWARKRNVVGSIAWPASQEGVMLYEN